MTNLKFNEDDRKQVIDFLNVIAKNAKFNLDTSEVIQYFRLLQHMQTKILPKIEANILEVIKVVDNAPAEPEAQPQSEAKKGKK